MRRRAGAEGRLARNGRADSLSAVVLSDHRPGWAAEYEAVAARLRTALGDLAVRVDHIGSTSVPGLAAKDQVDLQVIVPRLATERIAAALEPAGFELLTDPLTRQDHVPDTWTGETSAWDKLLFRPKTGRPVNVHVRVAGSPNERYALLFRDFLRANGEARAEWEGVKRRIAVASSSRDAYADAKDPLTDELMADAERWATATGWSVA